MLTRIVAVGVAGILTAAPGFAQPPRIDTTNTPYGSELRRLVRIPILDGQVTRAVAFHNDAEIWINRQTTAVVDASGCDVQRDFAASIWLQWSEMGVGPGSGITVKSYTGRVLASAEQTSSGPRFHC